MFFKKYSETDQYMYLIPREEGVAEWEIIDQTELEQRIDEDRLSENCRLFKIEREIKVSFERVTHLD